jgi:hypothetical protein
MAAGFPPTSRYATTEIAFHDDGDGRVTAYLRRRFLPQPEVFALLQFHAVTEGDRLDNVTASYLGDPEQFWQVADANRAMRPDDLMEIGRQLRITLPEGIPGVADA